MGGSVGAPRAEASETGDDLEDIRDLDHGEISPRDYRDSF